MFVIHSHITWFDKSLTESFRRIFFHFFRMHIFPTKLALTDQGKKGHKMQIMMMKTVWSREERSEKSYQKRVIRKEQSEKSEQNDLGVGYTDFFL